MRALILFITASLTFAQTPARPEFDVATIKLNTSVPDVIDNPEPVGGRFHSPFSTLRSLIAAAYNVKPFEILGGAAWIESDRDDVEANSADAKPIETDFRLMIRNLLAASIETEFTRKFELRTDSCCIPTCDGSSLILETNRSWSMWKKTESEPTDN